MVGIDSRCRQWGVNAGVTVRANKNGLNVENKIGYQCWAVYFTAITF